MPAVREGDDLASLVVTAAEAAGVRLRDGDILVVTQKVVSKSEGRVVRIANVRAGKKATRLGRELEKDPRLVQVILDEATRIVRVGHGVIITETPHGFVCANSGVDQSNVEGGFITTLPRDPDRSARKMRQGVKALTGRRVAVIITDTFGRPWREGQVEFAVGCSGIKATQKMEGVVDPFGYRLKVTEPAVVDSVAAAGALVMGKLEMTPAAIVRGLKYEESEDGVGPMLRSKELDLFR